MGFGGRLIIYGGNLVTFQGSIPCSPTLKTHTSNQITPTKVLSF